MDALFESIVRRFNQHALSFPQRPGGATLPPADPDRRYLLYLHIPYCISLCPFCSFHRVQYESNAATRYYELLRREIRLVSDRGFSFDELYVGGGTPTVQPDQLVKTIEELRAAHPIASVSVETNPDHLKSASLLRLREAGVDRLSVGVQSFDDGLLQAMHRLQSYGSGAEISERLKRLRQTFDTVNVDMIFNLPQQTAAMLKRDLDILIDDIGVDQVSFYPLMTSHITKQKMSETMGISSESHERKYYELIVERMLAAGYSRASAWCFSRRPGMFDEYIVDREEYVGLGSGAFSYIDGSLFASTFSIDQYLQMVEAGGTGTEKRRDMSERDQMRYHLVMTLFGGALDKRRAEQRFGGRFQHKLWPELTALQAMGAIKDSGETFILTESGYYQWVVMMREFFTGINNLRAQMRHNVVPEVPVQQTGE
ncbi:MAG: coproporphyrinogen III oxidase family protein [Woeseia sp.]